MEIDELEEEKLIKEKCKAPLFRVRKLLFS